MKAKPILMHGRSIRSLLAGRKTQTRRILKPQPTRENVTASCARDGVCYLGALGYAAVGDTWKCPYGKVGDLLYVRETFGYGCRPDPFEGAIDGIEYRADVACIDDVEDLPLYTPRTPDGFCYGDVIGDGWRPSIHMPRWASRITLHLTDIRVERVQAISVEDCKAEGVEPRGNMHGYLGAGYRPAFRELWEHTNGADAWNRNDWCWVLCFEVIQANVDDVLAEPARYGIKEVA